MNMDRKLMFLVAAVVCALTAVSTPVYSEWLEDGNLLIDDPDSQYDPVTVSDGAGGMIVGWREIDVGGFDIFAARFDGLGNKLWGPISICSASGSQSALRMATDGYGGALFTWTDDRSGVRSDIYAQRINADGSVLWIVDGVAVAATGADAINSRIASDGDGGAVIAWMDFRNGEWDVFCQHLNQSGTNIFVADGVSACSAADDQVNLEIVTDGSEGMIIVWRDFRSGTHYDIYAQRIDYIGNPIWAVDGISICTVGATTGEAKIVYDGMRGVIIAWYDSRSVTTDIYAQRVGSSGSAEWTNNGIALTSTMNNVQSPALVSDGLGGAYVVWGDARNVEWNVYAQRLDIDGNVLWTADGEKVCTGTHGQLEPGLALDGTGGILVGWRDARYGIYTLFVQRLDQDGKKVWAEEGIPASLSPMNHDELTVVTDGGGGMLLTWEAYSGGYWDAYGQRVERYGYWGYPSAYISSVQDISGDQGGSVSLEWDASRLDPWPEELITQYTVWRAIDEPAASAMFSRGALLVDDIAAVDLKALEQAVRIQHLAGETYYWELISTVDAYHLLGYSEIVSTLQDSTGESSAIHYFQVIAHSEWPVAYWISPPDSGWSVDNLAPCPPLGLEGEQSYVPEGLTLIWDPNTEADLSHYHVYRGDDIGFVPDPGNLVACTPDTNTFDGDWNWGFRYCYKVAAVDIHGNESEYAVLLTDEVTGDDTPPATSFLGQNYPNPFNPSTTISFGLSGPGLVSLRIYDVAGRLVRVLVDEERPAGRYDETWNGLDEAGGEIASGIYFYSLEAGDFKETRKMVLLR
jgi:hypothetical protein